MAILTILLSFVLVKTRAIFRMGQAKDLARRNDAVQIERAIIQALIDNLEPPGNIPYGSDQAKWICQYTYRGVQCMNPPIAGVDLSYLVPTYIPTIPKNPAVPDEGVSGFKIYKDGAFIIVVAVNDSGSGSSSS